MARYGWDVIHRKAVILSGATVSSSISVPRNCAAMTVITPAALTGASWKLQSLTPIADDAAETAVWNDAYTWVPGGGTTIVQLTFTTTVSQALTLISNTFGGGNLRIVSASAEAATRVFYVMFSGFQN